MNIVFWYGIVYFIIFIAKLSRFLFSASCVSTKKKIFLFVIVINFIISVTSSLIRSHPLRADRSRVYECVCARFSCFVYAITARLYTRRERVRAFYLNWNKLHSIIKREMKRYINKVLNWEKFAIPNISLVLALPIAEAGEREGICMQIERERVFGVGAVVENTFLFSVAVVVEQKRNEWTRALAFYSCHMVTQTV